MLENIEISNFQSHKSSSLELDKGLNIILGESDVGKSSIIRAIHWAVHNRPSGDSFRSVFSKKPTEVALGFTENGFVRSKGASFNGYNLETGDLKALRTEVPEEVSNIHKMEEINIQPQSKAYFLLDETPGQVAKEFNAVAGLEEMDRALQNVNSKIRQTTRNITSATELCEKTEQDIEKLSWIGKAEKDLQAFQTMNKQFETHQTDIAELTKVLNGLTDWTEKKDRLPDTAALPKVTAILDLDCRIDEDYKTYDYLDKLLNVLSAQRKKLKRYDVLLELRSLIPEGVSEQIAALNQKILTVSRLIEQIKAAHSSLQEQNSTILVRKEALKEISDQVKFCETCGQLLVTED